MSMTLEHLAESKLTQKHQITLHKQVRDKAGILPFEVLLEVPIPDGVLMLRSKPGALKRARAILNAINNFAWSKCLVITALGLGHTILLL